MLVLRSESCKGTSAPSACASGDAFVAQVVADSRRNITTSPPVLVGVGCSQHAGAVGGLGARDVSAVGEQSLTAAHPHRRREVG